MLIGTAGHIDHGKTALITRLTGRNTDRLPEEQKRGISIELGYAYVPLADSGVLGFIDVPGHERFVHTMLAGATGIDLALLVVAADDGLMPQTEEHLDILRLLGLRAGVVALTKLDAVAPARVAEVRAQLAHWLAGSPQADWPVFAVSARTGEGIAALDDHLRATAAAQAVRPQQGQFRLAIDRVFTLSGIGTVATGTVHAGSVRVNDEVVIQPTGLRARLRSLHAQDRPAEVGRAGERCALALAGVSKDQVERGLWVQAPALANLTERFDATLRLSAGEARALAAWTQVHLHHGTRDVLARVALLDCASLAPGGEALVSVQPVLPLPLCRGDRFVLRDAAASRTLAGGLVLDIAPPARGKRRPERLALLAALREDTPPRRPGAGRGPISPDPALSTWLAQSPIPLPRLTSGWNLRDDELQQLLTATGARVAGGVAFAPNAWQALQARVLEAVAATHEREPEMPGLEQNRLRRIVAPKLEADAFAALLDELLASARLARRGAFVALPSHQAELGATEKARWEKIKPLLTAAPFGTPRVRDIAKAIGIPEAEVRATLRAVARVGEVTLVALDHFFLTDAVARMADIAAELAQADGATRAAAFRDRIGGGRKVAIHILEFFDRVGFLRRLRDDHLLRRGNPWRGA
jgi:selenocysteine-specific elongation factor